MIIKINDLLSSILPTDEVLNDLFIARNENHLSSIKAKDKELLAPLKNAKEEAKEELMETIKTIVSEDNQSILKSAIENYMEAVTEYNSYFDEKLYKSGFIDAMTLNIIGIEKNNQHIVENVIKKEVKEPYQMNRFTIGLSIQKSIAKEMYFVRCDEINEVVKSHTEYELENDKDKRCLMLNEEFYKQGFKDGVHTILESVY